MNVAHDFQTKPNTLRWCVIYHTHRNGGIVRECRALTSLGRTVARVV